MISVSSKILVRNCTTVEEFHACVALQREIWGEADLEVEPATLFVVAAHTGGQTLGAFDGDRLIGYTLALPGVRNGTPFLHSHMTGVAAGYRDRGVGRSLKLFQRDEALGRGIRLIEWTFDPLETRNAHFNLNRLGAIARRYLPNLYGITSSPLHRGIPTDRLVAEWQLDSARVLTAISDDEKDAPVAAVPTPSLIQLPAEMEGRHITDPASVAATQSRIRIEFSDWFAKGYAAVATRTTAAGPAYVLAPWSDF